MDGLGLSRDRGARRTDCRNRLNQWVSNTLMSREAGLVLFPKRATFLPVLEAELLVFPQGPTDDQVDSITQALSYRPKYNYDSTMSWIG